jgi:hypothetical protein
VTRIRPESIGTAPGPVQPGYRSGPNGSRCPMETRDSDVFPNSAKHPGRQLVSAARVERLPFLLI